MSISAINHRRHDLLHELTLNYNKTALLDKLIYWWQHSTYTLNDNQKWFTRSVSRIAKDSCLSQRSVERYMKHFDDMGLIERRSVLLRKKNLYIRITDKLLGYIGKAPPKVETKAPKGEGLKNTERLPSEHFGGTDNATLAVSYIRSKEQIVKNNNTVSHEGTVINSDELPPTPSQQEQTKSAAEGEYKIEKEIGERITTRFKNYIKGTIKNVQEQGGLKYSSPDKLFAEVVFAMTNTTEQLPGIENTHHRMNIIAKLLREKRWKTPKGFYNHWDIGRVFKEREAVKQCQYKAYKQADGVNDPSIEQSPFFPADKIISNSDYYKKDHAQAQQKRDIRVLEMEISTQKKHLSTLEKRFEEGRGGITQGLIDICAISIAKLYDKMALIQAGDNSQLSLTG